jgi:ribosomal protein L37AE/L43A
MAQPVVVCPVCGQQVWQQILVEGVIFWACGHCGYLLPDK